VKSKSTVVALMLAALPAAALAQSSGTGSTLRVDQRQETQQKLIEHGVQSGQLTAKEAARLQRGQTKVQKMEDKAMKDGTLTDKERRRIQRAQDKEDRKIYREKSNKQRAK
jgi:hypothetical protein